MKGLFYILKGKCRGQIGMGRDTHKGTYIVECKNGRRIETSKLNCLPCQIVLRKPNTLRHRFLLIRFGDCAKYMYRQVNWAKVVQVKNSLYLIIPHTASYMVREYGKNWYARTLRDIDKL